MKKQIISIAIMALSTAAIAQSEALFTHYMNNTLAVNPAYAGSRQAITITGLHRSQWANFEGAPSTQTLTAHMPLMEDKLGIGLSILNDRIGPIKATQFNVDAAYRLKVNNRHKLVFGLKGGIGLQSGNLADLITDEKGDEEFMANIAPSAKPNFGFGVYYQAKRWYAGLSTPRILENKFEGEGENSLIAASRHFYLIGGYAHSINPAWLVKPTTMLRVRSNAPLSLDIGAEFVYRGAISMGAMYRSSNAIGVLLGYNFTKDFGVGYSFDWSTLNMTGVYNAGSHELFIRYDISTSDDTKVISSRFF